MYLFHFQSGIVHNYFTSAALKNCSEQSEIIVLDHVAKVDRAVSNHHEHICLEMKPDVIKNKLRIRK